MFLFQDLAERSGKIMSCLGEAPWEAKAIAVIACIRDPEVIMNIPAIIAMLIFSFDSQPSFSI